MRLRLFHRKVMEPNNEDYSLLSIDPKSPMDLIDPSNVAQSLPFHEQSAEGLQNELRAGGRWRWSVPVDKRLPKSRHRGNYVKGHIFSKLRIDAKAKRLPATWNLEAMWDSLPVELISSIFGLLHPVDLYHAICATKGLRYFLLDRRSAAIWKESFLNHRDIPFYPDDVSAPKWASLIFGPATCDTCGRENSLVEYTLRRRECDDCMDYCYSTDSELLACILPIIGDFPNYLNDIWKLAFKIYRDNAFYYPDEGRYSRLPTYSVRQAVEIAYKMRKYLLEIRSGAPDAKSNYESFVQLTEKASHARFKHAKCCNAWADKCFIESYKRLRYSVRKIIPRAKKEILKKGYHSNDVEPALPDFQRLIRTNWAIFSDPEIRKPKLWKYLPVLESMVTERQTIRRQNERIHRIAMRQAFVTRAYLDTLEKWLPKQTLICVPLDPEVIYDDEFFWNYINDPKEAIVLLDANLARQEVLRFVDAFVDAKKQRLVEILIEQGLLPERSSESSDPLSFLRLAIAIFKCCGETFVGWEEAATHRCQVGDEPTYMQDARDMSFSFCFSDDGYQALENLAKILHLDPLGSVKIADLEALTKRFVCKTCRFVRQAGVYGLPALTWRECLDHAVKSQNPFSKDQHVAVFDVLSEDLTENILALEQPYLSPINIIFVGLDENANHRCLRCPKSPKLWPKEPNLYRHLMDKHHIRQANIVEGVHWMKIRAVQDENWIQHKIQTQGKFIN